LKTVQGIPNLIGSYKILHVYLHPKYVIKTVVLIFKGEAEVMKGESMHQNLVLFGNTLCNNVDKQGVK